MTTVILFVLAAVAAVMAAANAADALRHRDWTGGMVIAAIAVGMAGIVVDLFEQLGVVFCG